MKSSESVSSLASTAEIGELVKMLRKEQGLTQLDLAGLAGLSNRFVIDLEKGKPTLQTQKVLDVLGLLGLELTLRKKA